MTDPTRPPKLTDAQLVDALRALGVQSVRSPDHDPELTDAERAYLLGSLLFVIEMELSLYATTQGTDALAHATRGHAHMVASASGKDPYKSPDGMPRDHAPHWWFILADRLDLMGLQFTAAQSFGGSAMANTPAHEQMTEIATGLADVVTNLTAMNYRLEGWDPRNSLQMLHEAAAAVEGAGEFLRTTTHAALHLKAQDDKA